MRDVQSYCGILLDDNNRKPICRLHFNGSKKYVTLFDVEGGERVDIVSLGAIQIVAILPWSRVPALGCCRPRHQWWPIQRYAQGWQCDNLNCTRMMRRRLLRVLEHG